jgi:F-type H+-transporting ATPase subunit O
MILSTARSAVAAGPARRFASSIALKYSNAVYSAALNKSPQTLTKVQTELTAISNAIKSTPELEQFVTNPTLSTADKTKGLQALYAKAEGSGAKKEPVSDLTKNFFTVLADNGRLNETQGVIEGFNELVAKYKGELTVVVTSAAALPKDSLSKLESALKQSQTAQQAKSLKIQNKVRDRLPACLPGHDMHNRSTRPYSVASSSTSATRQSTSACHRA